MKECGNCEYSKTLTEGENKGELKCRRWDAFVVSSQVCDSWHLKQEK